MPGVGLVPGFGVVDQLTQDYPNPVLQESNTVQGYDTNQPESNTPLPWGIDPNSSWLDYRCWVEYELDPGMALHKILPQTNPDVDTLAMIDMQDDQLDQNMPTPSGVNIGSASTEEDVIQRMATSTYRFVLRGYALRAGWQVPIPGLFDVGGNQPVPVWPQRATNMLVGNFSGVPLFYAVWELHYVVQQSPSAETGAPIPFNPSLQIRPDMELPDTIDAPVSMRDPEHQNPTPPQAPAGAGIIRPQRR